MNNNNSTGFRGVGFVGLLQIVFIVLKLCSVISWPWKIVFIPSLIYVSAKVVCIVLLIWIMR